MPGRQFGLDRELGLEDPDSFWCKHLENGGCQRGCVHGHILCHQFRRGICASPEQPFCTKGYHFTKPDPQRSEDWTPSWWTHRGWEWANSSAVDPRHSEDWWATSQKKDDGWEWADAPWANRSYDCNNSSWKSGPINRVSLDFHGVLDRWDVRSRRFFVPNEHRESVQMLKNVGWKVWVISFSGPERQANVRQQLAHTRILDLVEDVVFTKHRTGRQGKVPIIKALGIQVHVDDNMTICDEETASGMRAILISKSNWFGFEREPLYQVSRNLDAAISSLL